MRDMVRHLMAQNLTARIVDAARAAECRTLMAEYAGHRGKVLLTWPDGNSKLAKSVRPTYGLSLAPSTVSGEWNNCRYATKGCIKACLNTAGKGTFPVVQQGRVWKTLFLGADPQAFLDLLIHEIDLAVRRDEAVNVRLNVLSDIPWERITPALFTLWGDAVKFYDYTKWPDRAGSNVLDVTFSASERTTHQKVVGRSRAGQNVAMVFDTKVGQPLPLSWHGVTVVDGDESDDRTLDPRGRIVGLRAKGFAKQDRSGFVRQV